MNLDNNMFLILMFSLILMINQCGTNDKFNKLNSRIEKLEKAK